jgi:hypothetical protein
LKGEKSETALLNINLKTIISGFLQEYRTFVGATTAEKTRIVCFIDSNANFSNLQNLIGVKKMTENES